MTDFVETEMRQMCRNPRCRMRLPAPASNSRSAFCTRGCYEQFYRLRCRVCEKPIAQPQNGGVRVTCKKSKCINAWAGGLGFGCYAASKTPDAIQEVPENKGPETAPEDGRAWFIVAGPKLTLSQMHCATVGAEEVLAASRIANARFKRP